MTLTLSLNENEPMRASELSTRFQDLAAETAASTATSPTRLQQLVHRAWSAMAPYIRSHWQFLVVVSFLMFNTYSLVRLEGTVDNTESTVSNLESEMSNLQSEISNLQSEVSSLQSDLSDIQSELGSVRTELLFRR